MPLDPDERFLAVLGEIGQQSQTWNILDHETRVWTAIEGPSARFGADYEAGIEAGRANAIGEFRKVVDNMFVPAKKVVFGESGGPVATSSSPRDDCSPNIYYPPWKLHIVGPNIFGRTWLHTTLNEISRVASSVDLVEHTDRDLSTCQQIAKYHLTPGERGVEGFWREAFINLALDGRGYAPSFGRFILDGIRNVMIGFTTQIVPGRSLREDKGVFLRTWLEQLMDAIDDLNLNLGMIHQDITASNVFVSRDTGQLTIIGYGEAVMAGSPEQAYERNDTKGVFCLLYDVLTQDETRPRISLLQRDLDTIMDLKSWPVRCDLEPGLTLDEIHDMMFDWVSNRGVSRCRSGGETPLRLRPVAIPKMGYLNGLLSEYCDPQVHLDCYGLPQEARPPYQRDLPSSAQIIKWERPSTRHLRRESLMKAKRRVSALERGFDQETSRSVRYAQPASHRFFDHP